MTIQITLTELQALLKEQKQNCYDEAEIVYETLGSNNPEPVVSKRSILNAPTPDLSHLKEAPQLPDLKKVREKFFKECVVLEKDELKWDLFVTPLLLFEWFVNNLQLPKEK